jgi:hypothetical protein
MDEQLRDAQPRAPSLKHWKRKARAKTENVGPPICLNGESERPFLRSNLEDHQRRLRG